MTVGTGRAAPGPSAPTYDVGATPIAEVLRDPVRGLEHAVRALPSLPSPLSYTETETGRLDTTTKTWQQVARRAIVARHDLAGERDSYRDAHRWSLIADAAAITPVVLHLDRQLADAAGQLPDRKAIADALSDEANNPAALIAPRVTALARAGDLPNRLTVELPAASALPVQVASPGSFLEAQRRLSDQLAAENVSPATVTQTALGQAWMLDHASTLLQRHGFAPDAATTARELASRLDGISPTDGRVAALIPGDDSARTQTLEMTTYLARRMRNTDRLDGSELVALRGFVLRSPKVIDSLSRAAENQLNSGRWLVPADTNALTWTRFSSAETDPPRLVTDLQAARFSLPQLDARSAGALTSARDILANLRSTQATRPDKPEEAVTRRRGPSIGTN